jgi:catechol 2,3-dioxygenase-like lactoylglutathione lyase family enzyme
MKSIILAMLPAVLASAVFAAAQEKSPAVTVKRMTPNLYTDDVEACVRFWVDRLHFEKTMEVPQDGGNLAFAALQKGPIELMYGSYASLKKDADVSRSFERGTSFLFLEVNDVDATLAAMQGVPIVVPQHKIFYGSTEFTVKDPAGHLITFAQFAKP